MQQQITPNLWFDTQAEEAARFYTSVFENSRIVHVAHYTDAGPRAAGTVMTVEFELQGQRFIAINGDPEFKFDEAVSFLITCDDQDEVDYFWSRPLRRWRGGSVRLAEGQVRPVLAGRAEGDGEDLLRP
jgi:predicted 3-demethylubiquinone-9 3-methyltransferase (glyoxalase superfamily)